MEGPSGAIAQGLFRAIKSEGGTAFAVPPFPFPGYPVLIRVAGLVDEDDSDNHEDGADGHRDPAPYRDER